MFSGQFWLRYHLLILGPMYLSKYLHSYLHLYMNFNFVSTVLGVFTLEKAGVSVCYIMSLHDNRLLTYFISWQLCG